MSSFLRRFSRLSVIAIALAACCLSLLLRGAADLAPAARAAAVQKHPDRGSADRTGPRPGGVVWREDFAGGAPRAGTWTRCAQPFESRVEGCSAAMAGPGQQVYWNPGLMRGGRDPVVAAAGGGISILARPMLPEERRLLDAAIVAQLPIQPSAAGALAHARWTSGWLQTRRGFAQGTTVSAMIRPGEGAASWSGLWMLNDVAHRRWPPEIDVAEVTNDPDGRMHVRQVIHYRDAAGKLQQDGCPPALMPRDWFVASVTRTAREIRFAINGTQRCAVPTPPGFGDPMTVIFSQQVGGLARPADAQTAPFALDVRWVEVRQ